MELCRFKDLLVREVEKRNIEVLLSTHVTSEMVRTIDPDTLILAIGATPMMPPIPGIKNVLPALDIYFNPEVRIGQSVVMIGGGLVGCEVGLELAHRGKSVTVLEMTARLVANSIGIHRTALLDKKDRYGIRSRVNCRCGEIRTDGVVVEDRGGKQTFIAADTVVIGLGMTSQREEVRELRGAAGQIPVFEIGDCAGVANVGEAVQQGYMAAMSII